MTGLRLVCALAALGAASATNLTSTERGCIDKENRGQGMRDTGLPSNASADWSCQPSMPAGDCAAAEIASASRFATSNEMDESEFTSCCACGGGSHRLVTCYPFSAARAGSNSAAGCGVLGFFALVAAPHAGFVLLLALFFPLALWWRDRQRGVADARAFAKRALLPSALLLLDLGWLSRFESGGEAVPTAEAQMFSRFYFELVLLGLLGGLLLIVALQALQRRHPAGCAGMLRLAQRRLDAETPTVDAVEAMVRVASAATDDDVQDIELLVQMAAAEAQTAGGGGGEAVECEVVGVLSPARTLSSQAARLQGAGLRASASTLLAGLRPAGVELLPVVVVASSSVATLTPTGDRINTDHHRRTPSGAGHLLSPAGHLRAAQADLNVDPAAAALMSPGSAAALTVALAMDSDERGPPRQAAGDDGEGADEEGAVGVLQP